MAAIAHKPPSEGEFIIPDDSIGYLVRAVQFALEEKQNRNSASHVDHVLTEYELAARWKMSVKSLQRWRQTSMGPCHIKLGRKVVYRYDDVLAFEQLCLRKSTSEKVV